MSTTYTSRLALPKSQLDDADWHLPIIAAADALDAGALGMLAVRAAAPSGASGLPSTSLDVTVAAGSYLDAGGVVATFAGTTVTMPTSTTRYLWLTAAGSLTHGSAWPTDEGVVRLAQVTTSATTVTAIVDARVLAARTPPAPLSVTATATLKPGLASVLADATAGAISLTLPSVAPVGHELVLIKTDASANAVSILAASGHTINNVTFTSLPSQWKYLRLLRVGATAWAIVGSN